MTNCHWTQFIPPTLARRVSPADWSKQFDWVIWDNHKNGGMQPHFWIQCNCQAHNQHIMIQKSVQWVHRQHNHRNVLRCNRLLTAVEDLGSDGSNHLFFMGMRQIVILFQHLDALRPHADSWTTMFFFHVFICFCVCDKQIVCPSFSLQNASLLKEQFCRKVVHVLTLIWEMIRWRLSCLRHRWFQWWLEALWVYQWQWRWSLERQFERQFYQLADIFMFLHERNKRTFAKRCEDNLKWGNQLKTAFQERIQEMISLIERQHLRDNLIVRWNQNSTTFLHHPRISCSQKST